MSAGGSGGAVAGALRRPSDLRAELRGRRREGRGRKEVEHLSWPDGFAAGRAERSALIVLLHLASLTARRLLELAQDHPTASACLRAAEEEGAASDADRSLATVVDPAAVEDRLRGIGARFLFVGDPEYPRELLHLPDPPAGLFVRGLPLGELTPRVAMVGARSCSSIGKEVATAFGRGLAGAGVCVVSGGARGIDAASHRGALRAGGRTIAVLGCGIDLLYPGQNRALLREVLGSGALVSEYPPGTPAEPFRFPARNRIVAALSRAVVVVEGALGSGSLITAEHALEIGRDVLAVPGSITNPLAAVPHLLIRDGAALVRGLDDLFADLGLGPPPTGSEEGHAAGSARFPQGLDSDLERRTWEALKVPTSPDDLAKRAGVPLPEVVAALIGLELRGLVRQVGGRYERRWVISGGSS